MFKYVNINVHIGFYSLAVNWDISEKKKIIYNWVQIQTTKFCKWMLKQRYINVTINEASVSMSDRILSPQNRHKVGGMFVTCLWGQTCFVGRLEWGARGRRQSSPRHTTSRSLSPAPQDNARPPAGPGKHSTGRQDTGKDNTKVTITSASVYHLFLCLVLELLHTTDTGCSQSMIRSVRSTQFNLLNQFCW